MASNQAAWLDGKGAQLRVAESAMPKPGADEVVIKNHAIAINPVDWKIQDSGMFLKSFPNVLGCDVAGEIYEVGSNVKNFKKGDRVASHCISLLTSKPQDGGFQLYTSCPAGTTGKIPEGISLTDASVLPLALDTAAVGLFQPSSGGHLGLPFPTLEKKDSGKTIIVWGGSSSVGALAIQLAVAAGAKVIATASKRNFDFCKSAGAIEVLDYSSSSIVDDLIAAVKNAGGEFAGVYDSIALPDQSLNTIFKALEKLGGGNVAVVLPPPENVPSGVKAGHVFGINPLTHPIWADFVTPALEKGVLKCLPPPKVVGKGLESVQKGCDENKKGVSAAKVVIEL